jgi:hypothetical protein
MELSDNMVHWEYDSRYQYQHQENVIHDSIETVYILNGPRRSRS